MNRRKIGGLTLAVLLGVSGGGIDPLQAATTAASPVAAKKPVPLRNGVASWYRYKGCNCAASPDYPKGTMLKVTLEGSPKKSVIVRVNDYGPNRKIFPNRAIDLDAVAFRAFAPLSRGVIRVKVEPVSPAPAKK